MNQETQLRQYYNSTIRKELKRLESKRYRLMILFGISILCMLTIGILALQSKIPAFAMFIWFPLTLYGFFLGSRIRKFKSVFKPPIVNLILRFLKLNLNYDFKGLIPKKAFHESGLFITDAPFYNGEDYFYGKIGDVHFEMCELDVRHISNVTNNEEYVFRGILFHADFPESFHGKILMFPTKDLPHHTHAIKSLARQGGYRIKVPNPRFESLFNTYADKNVEPSNLLSDEIYETILDYQQKIDKKISVSFVESHIFIAIHEPKDILEPHIFRSNVKFKFVQDFYDDIRNITRIIEDFNLHQK